MGSEGGRRKPLHALLSFETDPAMKGPPAPASAGIGKTSDRDVDGKSPDGSYCIETEELMELLMVPSALASAVANATAAWGR